MATTTATTKTTTRTSRARLATATLTCALVLFAILNFTGTMTPLEHANKRIEAAFENAKTLSKKERLEALVTLRAQQEQALAGKPVEPFAWARFAYLRRMVQGDAADAFAALHMSDLVSPYEPRQMLERALMWRDYQAVENAEQKAYQSVLWQKAFRRQPNETWQAANEKNLVAEVDDALKADPELTEWWKAKKAGRVN